MGGKRGANKNGVRSKPVAKRDTGKGKPEAAPLPTRDKAGSGKDVERDPEAVMCGLPDAEQEFLRRVSFDCSSPPSRPNEKKKKHLETETESKLVHSAVECLNKYQMCILHNVLSDSEVAAVHAEFYDMLDLTGDSAIGEKDASKRSGTRMYNCKCQVGPSCHFHGWKERTRATRQVLHPPCSRHEDGLYVAPASLKIWEKVTSAFGFEHIKRVEVVTSHSGCRAQDWHVDAVYGLTVIFPLVPVDLRKGPTEIDFTVPHNSLIEGSGKIKRREPDSPDSARATLPVGSVILFNANASHRGTANISTGERPILVLDCSPKCSSEQSSLWDL